MIINRPTKHNEALKSRSSFLRIVTVSIGLTIGATWSWHAFAHGDDHNPVRQQFVMKNGIPTAYAGVTNPLTKSTQNIVSGGSLYAENCAGCHGAKGAGDGPDGKDLQPRPPELLQMMAMLAEMMKDGHKMNMDHMGMQGGQSGMMMSEGYLFWSISEGGIALDTGMPPFKEVLSEKERWQIILFMMNGFETPAKSGGMGAVVTVRSGW